MQPGLKKKLIYFSSNGDPVCSTATFRPNLHSKQAYLKCISLAGLDSKYSPPWVNYTFQGTAVAKHKTSQLFYRNPGRVEVQAQDI